MPAPSGTALRAKAPPFGYLAPLDSRALYIKFTRSMRLETLIRCQIMHRVHRTVDAEALVRFDHVRYSVPARHAGARVDVEAAGGAIRIRCGDLILAEHLRSSIRDARVEDPEHVKERYDLSLLPTAPPPSRGPVLAFEQALEVEARPLSFYQEIL